MLPAFTSEDRFPLATVRAARLPPTLTPPKPVPALPKVMDLAFLVMFQVPSLIGPPIRAVARAAVRPTGAVSVRSASNSPGTVKVAMDGAVIGPGVAADTAVHDAEDRRVIGTALLSVVPDTPLVNETAVPVTPVFPRMIVPLVADRSDTDRTPAKLIDPAG